MFFCGCVPDQNSPVPAAPAVAVQSVEVEPDPDLPSLLAISSEALQAGDIKAARRTIQKAFSMAPDNPQVVFTMALVLGNEHRYPEAIMMLDALAQTVPETQLPALGQTAEWLVQSGDWEEAETRYRAVLAAVPDAAMADRQLAQLLVREGRRLEAAHSLRALCEQGNIEEIELRALLSLALPFAADASLEQLDPIGPLGRARAAAGRNEWDSAIVELKSAASPTLSESALLGRAFAEQQDFESLDEWINSNVATNTDNPDAWFAQGVSAARDKNDAVAVKYFCEAILHDSTDEKAYFQMAASLNRLATVDANVSTEQAETVLQRARSLARTREIGQQLAESDQRDLNDLSELAQLLEELRRPHESLAWQAVRIAYADSSIDEDERQLQLTEINRRRVELAKNPIPVDQQFLLCGIDHESIELGDHNAEKLEEDGPSGD